MRLDIPRYSSYIGEITPACSNIVNNNFHTDSHNKIWLTDITEFSAKESKLYLSPMIDCFDSKVISYALSNHPDQCLVDKMLEGALTTLKITECKSLAIHTDKGGHYRGGRWIERLEGLGITRSMSRKGNSGDNAACEGFFRRMKKKCIIHLTGIVQKNYVKLFILILIFTTTTELKWGLKDNYGTSCYDCTKCLKNCPKPLVTLNVKLF